MRTYGLLTLGVCCLLWTATGCISVKAPERVVVGESRPEPVDSSRVPETASHEEARQELRKAYQNIQYLERESAHWHEKAAEYKRERDECRDKLERYEDD
ncbi:MAG: hypothetical protein PVJ57_21995 [Phycisphaerae bacterium]